MSAVSVVGATVQTMRQQISATFTNLEQLDASQELETAFQDADSCAEHPEAELLEV